MEIKTLLDSCIAVAPHVGPNEPGLMRPTMAHPESAANIIVTEVEGEKLKHTTIDWQGTTVAPFFMQARVPPAVVYARRLLHAFFPRRYGSAPSRGTRGAPSSSHAGMQAPILS